MLSHLEYVRQIEQNRTKCCQRNCINNIQFLALTCGSTVNKLAYNVRSIKRNNRKKI